MLPRNKIAFFLTLTFAVIGPFGSRPVRAAGSKGFSLLRDEVVDDFKWMVNNFEMDAIDVATSPLHIADENSWFRKPKTYLILAGVGGVWTGSYFLDQTIRSHLRDMGHGTADTLQNISYDTVSVTTGLMYAWGLYDNDVKARHAAITAGEGALVATLLDIGIKAAFGRLRPRQDGHDHDAWFEGGASFVSGDVTPMFALAAGVSEYFDNKWYIAAPIYSAALLDGFGRIGNNAHWFSDVIGAALLGWATTELFFYLHRRHAMDPSRFRIFPMSAAGGAMQTSFGGFAPMGMGVAFNW